MAIRGPGLTGPTPKTLPGQLPRMAQLPGDFRSPLAPAVGDTMAAGLGAPRTPAEFWAQRMAGAAEPQQANPDKRYGLPRFGPGARRARRGGENRATPATPATPAAPGTVATPAVPAVPQTIAAPAPLIPSPGYGGPGSVRTTVRRPPPTLMTA